MVIENIEKIRIAKGITKRKMAELLGFKTPMGYTHLSRGTGCLTAERIEIIAKVLGVEPGVFFDDKLTQSVVDEIEKTKGEVDK